MLNYIGMVEKFAGGVAMIKFTQRERDCLSIILTEKRITLKRLSSRLGVKPPTAHSLVGRLAGRGLVLKDENNAIGLTRLGTKNAEEMMFKHRVMETLLSKNGVRKDEACAECKKLDFLLSDKIAEEIFEKLNRPKFCPHGKPIIEMKNV